MTAQRMAAEGLAETRCAVHALRTDCRPLNKELGRVTVSHGERYHVGVSFAVGGVPRPLPPDATVALLLRCYKSAGGVEPLSLSPDQRGGAG